MAPIWDEPTIVPPSKHTRNIYTGNTTQHQQRRWPRGGRTAAPDQRPENTGTQEYPRPVAGTRRLKAGAPGQRQQPGEAGHGHQTGGPGQGPKNSTGSEQHSRARQDDHE